ncbi:MAG: virulence factor MviN [Planctomycetota bacterium]|nr:virulence factor MviN [Planctomycetota bacterium]
MKQRLLAATAIWSASILLSRLVGLVREAALGRTLGIGDSADLYQAAFTVPDFLNYLLAGGAMAVVLVPLQAARRARGTARLDEPGLAAARVDHPAEADRDAWRSIATIANAVGIALSVLCAMAWFAMPWLVRVAAPGFDDAQHAELARLSRILLPAQIFHVLGAVFSAALLARDRHLVPAVAPVVYNLAIVACGLASGTPEGFAWGVLVGAFAGPFLMPLVASLRLGFRWMPRIEPRGSDLRAWFLRSLPIMAGFSIVVADDWFLRAEGTILATGAAATLGYAKALLRVPIGMFGMAAGLAAYPLLARLAAEARHTELRAQLSRALRSVALLALVAQAVLVTAGVDLAALVYGRTRLDPGEIAAVADALSLCAIGLAAWAAQPLLSRGFYAVGNTWTPALLGTAVALAAWPVYGIARERFGIAGLAATSALAITLHAVVLYASLARRLNREGAERPAGLIPFTARALTSFAVALGIGLALARALPEASTTIGSAVRGAVVSAGCIAGFVATGACLGLTEIRGAAAPILRRLRGAPTTP